MEKSQSNQDEVNTSGRKTLGDTAFELRLPTSEKANYTKFVQEQKM